MALLAIETSTRQLGVAVVGESGVVSSFELLADYPHAVELPGAVDRTVKAAGLKLEQLEGVAIDIGPGSFTGLRIGLAFAKALVYRWKKPIIGVSSLDVLAANVAAAPGLVCPVLDARQKNVYLARYRIEQGRLNRQSDWMLGPVDDMISTVAEPALFLGDGAQVYKERIMAKCPQPSFAAPEMSWPRAATVGRLAYERFQQGQTDDPATIVPLYLYPLDCSVRSPDRPTSILPKAASSPQQKQPTASSLS
jgi:tRNA threonylcarbamoyl adenosine modification protein YeaZ